MPQTLTCHYLYILLYAVADLKNEIMFYYYGRKKKIGNKYKLSTKDIIIEPFAGSAAYSLRKENINKNVILFEKSKRIYDLWKWLIEVAEYDDIIKLGNIKKGDKVNEFIKILHSASKRAFDYKTITVTSVMEANWNSNLPKMAELVGKIKHWKIYNNCYSEIDNVVGNLDSCWFVDPPYKGDAGTGYSHSSKDIDYDKLSEWCKNRKGDVIVCEGLDANWLPFEKLTQQSTINGKKNNELVYYQFH